MGYQPQELLGQLCFDFFHPEDLKHMTESFEQGKEIRLFQFETLLSLENKIICLNGVLIDRLTFIAVFFIF